MGAGRAGAVAGPLLAGAFMRFGLHVGWSKTAFAVLVGVSAGQTLMSVMHIVVERWTKGDSDGDGSR